MSGELMGRFYLKLTFPPDVTRTIPRGGSPASLFIPAIPQYNNTVVQCEALLLAEETILIFMSCPALLVVQGELIIVHQLNSPYIVIIP